MILAKKLFINAFSGLRDGSLQLVCPDERFSFGDPQSALCATLVVHDERFFARAVFQGDIGIGESFVDGDWSSPDLVSLVRLGVRNLDCLEGGNRWVSFFAQAVDTFRHRRKGNTVTGSRENIRYHYDLGNEFYQLFLDSSLAYSCGYYISGDEPLEVAQMQKYDLICRKLQLNHGDHLLEIGTGWGGFAEFAARNYGCRITTTTISKQQYNYAAARFQEPGNADCEIELLFEDYRNLKGHYDKIVSIEMFEAVGLEHYADYFRACDRLLTADGVMLLQTITINERTFPAYRKRCDWIQKHIFPGSELASVLEIGRSLARETSMSISNLEDIGMHYAFTLAEWRRRFLARRSDAAGLGFDARFLRMWDYYFAYCEAAFRERHTSDVQLLISKTRSERGLMNEPWHQARENASQFSVYQPER